MLRTPADWITAARFALAIVLFALLTWIQQGEPVEKRALYGAALAIFVVAALSDAVDGAVARRTGTSDFGRVADPFVDKVLVVGALVFLAAIPGTQRVVPAWAVVLIVAREFLVTGIRGYVESKGLPFPADRLGKAKMVLQCIVVGGGLLLLANEPTGVHDASLGLLLEALTEGIRSPATGWERAMEWAPLVFHGGLWLSVVLTVISGVAYVLRARRLLAQAPAAVA